MRAFDMACLEGVPTREVHGELHTGIGQEAVGAGMVGFLKREDAVVSTHRNHFHALAKGVPPRELMADYCVAVPEWPCATGEKYYGRGPMQLSYNFNYGPAGIALGADLLDHPGLVSSDAELSFAAALWFWMTPQSPKPSCHDVMTGGWSPSAGDTAAGRVAGFGLTVDIINGGVECGRPTPATVVDRIAFYERAADLLDVTSGDHLDCATMQPY